jgi:hypothetical protein
VTYKCPHCLGDGEYLDVFEMDISRSTNPNAPPNYVDIEIPKKCPVCYGNGEADTPFISCGWCKAIFPTAICETYEDEDGKYLVCPDCDDAVDSGI